MPVVIYSFDYDGCLRREDNLSTGIIDGNQELLDGIIQKSKDKAHTYVLIGSTRQSYEYDCFNRIRLRNGSCFDSTLKLTEHLKEKLENKVTFIPMLMADIYSDLDLGTSFDRFIKDEQELELIANAFSNISRAKAYLAKKFDLKPEEVTLGDILLRLKLKFTNHDSFYSELNKIKSELNNITMNLTGLYCVNKDPHAKTYEDKTKLTILYSQMHERAAAAAKEFPGETLEYHFFDDREDILEANKTFFTRYPHLIPKNMTLHLHQYKGIKDEEKFTIVGTGAIDNNFRKTVKNMIAISANKPKDDFDQVIDVAKSEKLNNVLDTMPRDGTFSDVFNAREHEFPEPFPGGVPEFKPEPHKNSTLPSSDSKVVEAQTLQVTNGARLSPELNKVIMQINIRIVLLWLSGNCNPFMRTSSCKISAMKNLKTYLKEQPPTGSLAQSIEQWENSSSSSQNKTNKAILSEHRNKFFSTNRPDVKTSTEEFVSSLKALTLS